MNRAHKLINKWKKDGDERTAVFPIPLNLLLLILQANLQLVLEKVPWEGNRKEVSKATYYIVYLMN